MNLWCYMNVLSHFITLVSIAQSMTRPPSLVLEIKGNLFYMYTRGCIRCICADECTIVIVLYCIVLYIHIYIAFLKVQAKQRRFQCILVPGKRQGLRRERD